MRKIIALLLVVTVCLSIFTCNVYALESDETMPNRDISRIVCGFQGFFDVCYVNGVCDAEPGTSSMSGTLDVYESFGIIFWRRIHSWGVATVGGTTVQLYRNFPYTSGTKYKVVFSVTAIKNGVSCSASTQAVITAP